MLERIINFFILVVQEIRKIINFIVREVKLIIAIIIIILLAFIVFNQHRFISAVIFNYKQQVVYLEQENTELRKLLYEDLQEIRVKVEKMEDVYMEMHNILYGGKDDPDIIRIETMNDYVRSRSGLTVDEINVLLENTMIKGHGAYFLVAERIFQVNAWFLLSVSVHETGWWKSNYAINRNNLFGWKAYTHNPDFAQRFDSPGECILYVAERISKLYLQEDGKYYKGGTVAAIGHYYATDKKWSQKVVNRRKELENLLKSIS